MECWHTEFRPVSFVKQVRPCPDCGAEMRILAFIEEDRVIGRILRHLGLLPDASHGPPLPEPVYEPIYNDLPAVEEEDVVYQPF